MKEPNEKEIIELALNVGKFTPEQELEAIEQMKSLAWHWFRKDLFKEMPLADFVKTRQESRDIKNNLIKRAEERLEFSKSINRFSDVGFFEDLIKFLKGV